MKSQFFIVAAISMLTLAGCRTIDGSTTDGLTDAIRSSAEKGTPILFSGLGYVSLGFEQEKICDVQERVVCATLVPTESMMIYREAYNRNIVQVEGIVEWVSQGGYCTRECSHPVIRVVSVPAPNQIHPDRSMAVAVREIDFERVVFDADVTAYQELAGLAEALLSRRAPDLSNMDLFQSSMTDGALSAAIRDRIEWISRIIRRSRRDVEMLPFHAVQIRDDLDPNKLSDDGLICFCMYDACDRSELRLDVMNQSTGDAALCLPVDRSSGQWKFEREFFSAPTDRSYGPPRVS